MPAAGVTFGHARLGHCAPGRWARDRV